MYIFLYLSIYTFILYWFLLSIISRRNCQCRFRLYHHNYGSVLFGFWEQAGLAAVCTMRNWICIVYGDSMILFCHVCSTFITLVTSPFQLSLKSKINFPCCALPVSKTNTDVSKNILDAEISFGCLNKFGYQLWDVLYRTILAFKTVWEFIIWLMLR